MEPISRVSATKCNLDRCTKGYPWKAGQKYPRLKPLFEPYLFGVPAPKECLNGLNNGEIAAYPYKQVGICWNDDKSYFPAEILVSVGIGLAVKGELTISRHGFTVHYQTLSTNKDVFTWGSLTELSYSPMSQKLKFTVEDRHFTLQGNQAQLLNHLMDVLVSKTSSSIVYGKHNGKTTTESLQVASSCLVKKHSISFLAANNRPYLTSPIFGFLAQRFNISK